MLQKTIFLIFLYLFMVLEIKAQEQTEPTPQPSNWDGLKKRSKFKKGAIFFGTNISFSDSEGQNDFIVANIDLLKVDNKGAKFSFVGGYFLTPLVSVGLRGNYGFARNEQIMEADFLNMAFNATQYKTQTLRNNFEVHGFIRNYIPFGEFGSFYIFNETSFYYLNFNNYQRATKNPGKTDESISVILAKTQGLGIGTSLGVTYFASKKFAVELQLGTTGLEVQYKKTLKENVDEGETRKISFRNGLGILNVQMGFTYYFGINS